MTAAKKIRADYVRLESIAQSFGREASKTHQTLQALHKGTDVLLDGAWVGQNATDFYREMVSDVLPAVKRLGDALEQAAGKTKQISQIVKQAEADAAAVFKAVGSGLTLGGVEVNLKPDAGAAGAVSGNGKDPGLAQAAPDAGTPTPTSTPQPPVRIENVSQTELSVFLSQYEDSKDIPPEVLKKYLTDPALMKIQREVVMEVADRAQQGLPPLTPKEFYDLVLKHTGDPGTALLISNNVLKSFSRGLSPIGWEKESSSPLKYTLKDEQGNIIKSYEFDPAKLPPGAEGTAPRLNPQTGQAEQVPSAFYRTFSPTALGDSDPGDWYHYFGEATVAYYGATGRATLNDSGNSGSLTYPSIVGSTVSSVSQQMYNASVTDSPAYQGWRWANSLSFLEGGHYGNDFAASPEIGQAETLRESTMHREGAAFGLEQAGATVQWDWYVPKSGSLGVTDGLFGVNLKDTTYRTISSTGQPTPTPTPTSTPVSNPSGTPTPGTGGRL